MLRGVGRHFMCNKTRSASGFSHELLCLFTLEYSNTYECWRWITLILKQSMSLKLLSDGSKFLEVVNCLVVATSILKSYFISFVSPFFCFKLYMLTEQNSRNLLICLFCFYFRLLPIFYSGCFISWYLFDWLLLLLFYWRVHISRFTY